MKHSILVCSILLAGCSGNPEYSHTGDNRVNMAGASQLFPHGEFVTIDLARQIANDTQLQNWETDNGYMVLGYEISQGSQTPPKGKHKTVITSKKLFCEPDSDPSSKSCILARARLDYAFELYTQKQPKAQKKIRNELQDRIIAASEQRCNVYKMYLKRSESRNNFWLGTLTTVLGGAGALFTNQVGNRILSGLAGISSGVRAEFNQAYLASQAAQVITKGITSRRNELRKKLQAKHNEDTTVYTLQAAIADAIEYHGACNILTGLEAAESAIEKVENPGLDMMAKTLYKSRHIEEILKGTNPEQFTFDKLANVGAASQSSSQDTVAMPFATHFVSLKGNLIQALYTKAYAKPEISEKLFALMDEEKSAGKTWLDAIDEKYNDFETKIQAAYIDELNKLKTPASEQEKLKAELKLQALDAQLTAQRLYVSTLLEQFYQALDTVDNKTQSIAAYFQSLFDGLPSYS
ncbi:hypothetical protein J8Z24_18730 [Pseudoalteromonas sp. SCSIO 43201]|uniref:hypothetical protein n=1 Tax=Pseudoalteromonas TaxID=53246 RepID=UPI002075DCDE|nr:MULTISPECIES: hypothetical protein [Pseudoalteromonas]MDW7549135.1 hypothetical protein [Pseudoalteromonas peptidolytica]USD30994.1 hypothetical protein J8Z24_18730 [Pseudoalteromonas sp. SCSIO 43201]